MPIEFIQLQDVPPPLDACPRCKAVPFEPFLRGQVQRPKRRWWWPFGAIRDYCAVICWSCKEIVGWEAPDHMKSEIIRPHRLSPGRVVIAIVIAWSSWYASRVIEGLQRERASSVCTSTVLYPGPDCPNGTWEHACPTGPTWRCRP